MKRIIALALLVVAGMSSKAQGAFGTDSVKCWENTQVYYQLYKSKQYAEAYESWKYVYDNCPAAYKNTFIFASNIIEARMKKVTDPAQKQALEQLLIESYDKRLEYFPEKQGYVYGQKGLDLLKYQDNNPQAAYDAFVKAYEADGYDQPAAVFNGYFLAAARLFNAKVFTIEDVFNAYNVVSEAIEKNNNLLNLKIKEYKDKEEAAGALEEKDAKELGKLERELERYDVVDGNVEKILGPIATCDKLTLIYNQEAFNANKGDATWLRRAAKMLQKERRNDEGEMEDCTSDPIFFQVAEALYKLEPSPTSARALGKIALVNKDYSKAADYFKQAAEQEADPRKAADDYLKVAVSYQRAGSLASAKTYCIKAASLRKNWGDPYVVLATLYAQADGACGSNLFENKAVYWAAIDKLQYAKSIDGDVAGKADRLIAAYQKQFPDKGVSFQLGKKDGDKYTIGCWINETITARW